MAIALGLAVWLSWPRQESDPTFDARVARPAYATTHPRVLFDEAHFNVHKAGWRYKPFADLIANDGYLVERITRRFTEASLSGHDVLVIANALGFWGVLQALANRFGLEGKLEVNRGAFAPAECNTVAAWVRRGARSSSSPTIRPAERPRSGSPRGSAWT